MFQEPIEDKYNDLLKQRVMLEGELALARQQAETEIAKLRSKNKRLWFFLILLPFLTFWWCKHTYITPLTQQVNIQQDSIVRLQTQLASIKKVKKESVQYVIKKGDTLATIGQLFFNDSLAGYQIGVDNGIVSDYQHRHLTPGNSLVIHYCQESPPLSSR